MLLVTAPEMANLDRKTIEEVGIPGIVLMENAARGALGPFLEAVPDLLRRRVCIMAGAGNNAGDGFVLARVLQDKGAMVHVVCLRAPGSLQGDALTNFLILDKMSVPVTVWEEGGDFSSQWQVVERSDVLIDAILGTGLRSEVRGLCRQVIEAMNTLPVPRLAVDIPSGLDASTGKVLGVAVRATATATFGCLKVGLVVEPGVEFVGRLSLVDIGIPRVVTSGSGISRWWIDEEFAAGCLSPRSPWVHKGTAGHVCVLAGSRGKTGAAALVCHGAARVGAGLVTLFVPGSLNPVLEVKLTEPMTCPIAETDEQSPSVSALGAVLEFLEGKQAFALGPGVSLHADTRNLILSLIPRVPCPMVLDADALTTVADHLHLLDGLSHPAVLTPHPGEMARLIGGTTRDVQENRLEVASRFSRRHGVTLVLKGFRTVIASPDGSLAVNSSGNPAMAAGGMGDTLTGMIAGFLAQGLDPFRAACLGVYTHGAAADKRLGKTTSRGLLASDCLEEIPRIIGHLETRGQTGPPCVP